MGAFGAQEKNNPNAPMHSASRVTQEGLGIALGEVGSTTEHENPPDIEFPISHLPEQSAWQEVRLRVG